MKKRHGGHRRRSGLKQWGIGAVGSAHDWQSWGQGFEPPMLHQYQWKSTLEALKFQRVFFIVSCEFLRKIVKSMKINHAKAINLMHWYVALWKHSKLNPGEKTSVSFAIDIYLYYNKNIRAMGFGNSHEAAGSARLFTGNRPDRWGCPGFSCFYEAMSGGETGKWMEKRYGKYVEKFRWKRRSLRRFC